MSEQAVPPAPTGTFKPKKSVALSGTAAGNTALCTVGRSGNDLHYRGYDILDFANTAEFEEIAYLLVHGKLPNKAELAGYKAKLKSLRGIPAAVPLRATDFFGLNVPVGAGGTACSLIVASFAYLFCANSWSSLSS